MLIFVYNNSKSEFGDNFEFDFRGIFTHEFTTLATSCQALALSRAVLPEPVNCPNSTSFLFSTTSTTTISSLTFQLLFLDRLQENTLTFHRHIFFFADDTVCHISKWWKFLPSTFSTHKSSTGASPLLNARQQVYMSVSGPRRWSYVGLGLDVPCHCSMAMSVERAVQNLQPFTGNGEVSIWVKKSIGTKIPKQLNKNKIPITDENKTWNVEAKLGSPRRRFPCDFKSVLFKTV